MSHGCSDRAQIHTGARSVTLSKNELSLGEVQPTPSKTTVLPAAASGLAEALLALQKFQPRRLEPKLRFEALADLAQVRRLG